MRSKARALPFVILLLPFDLLVAFGISLASFCVLVLLWLRTQRNKGTKTRRLDPSATIIIVNWDGKHLLAECLPAVIEAVRFDGRQHEILVVDNGSTDG